MDFVATAVRRPTLRNVVMRRVTMLLLRVLLGLEQAGPVASQRVVPRVAAGHSARQRHVEHEQPPRTQRGMNAAKNAVQCVGRVSRVEQVVEDLADRRHGDAGPQPRRQKGPRCETRRAEHALCAIATIDGEMS